MRISLGRSRRGALRSTLTVAVIALGVGVWQGVAGASAPSPLYNVACNVSGQTTAAWSHSFVTDVVFAWFDTTPTVITIVDEPVAKPPKSASGSTPVGAAVLATYFNLKGGGQTFFGTTACA